MRNSALLGLLAPLVWGPLLLGCGVKRYLPGPPALDDAQVQALRVPSASGVRYLDEARQAVPLLPVQIFGLFYGLDIVVVSRHPDWDMHEYARVDLPDGALWLAKDSRSGSLVQGIVADLDDIDTWLPEVPVPRRQGVVQVEGEGAQKGDGRRVDLRIAYENLDGQQVQVEVRGTVKKKPPPRRNGSTMGHSAQAAAVALDLQRFGSAGRTRMRFDGERVGVRHLLGIYPMRFLLEQVQAGLVVTDMVQRAEEDGLRVQRPGPGATDPVTGQPGWPTATAQDEVWTVRAEDGETLVELQGPVTTLRYAFVDGELVRAEVWQVEREDPVLRLFLHPALPDLRRRFEGQADSTLEVEVGGQPGHATGTLSARWTDADTVSLDFQPTAPWWFADRPMAGQLRHDADGSAHLVLSRVPVEP